MSDSGKTDLNIYYGRIELEHFWV